MAAATSSGEPAGRARATDAALGTLRAATPAARRTAVGVTEPSAAAGPRPTSTSSGVLTTPAVGTLTLSPALTGDPERGQQRAQLAAPRLTDLGGLLAQDRALVGGQDSHHHGVGAGLGGAGAAERVRRRHPGMLGEASDTVALR